MDEIFKQTHNKVRVVFLLLAAPSVFLIIGGVLLDTFGKLDGNRLQSTFGIASQIIGFTLFLILGIRAGKIYVEESRQLEDFTSSHQ